MHGGQRQLQHNRLVQLRENRKQERRMYWKDLIKIEIATILSIAWFIQMELLRTNQVHSQFTFTQMQKFPTMQRDVAKQASRVYNDMYRDRTNSQFILCDIGNDQLDGRIGYVDWFDADNLGYRSLLCPKGSSDFGHSIPMLVKPENMQAVTMVEPRKYNKKPKVDQSFVAIHNFMPSSNCDVYHVKIPHHVFQHVCKVHTPPEKSPNEAYQTLVTILEKQEEKDRENEVKLFNEKADYQKAMDTLLTHRKAVVSRPPKKSRKNTKELSSTHNVQVEAVWKAKIEHIQATINNKQAHDGEHLFTFPFHTTDNSLTSCSSGLIELGGQLGDRAHDDVIFQKSTATDTVVITTTSVRSLSPGVDINEDVMNFCLKW